MLRHCQLIYIVYYLHVCLCCNVPERVCCVCLLWKYVENNKAADIDWFRLESNKEGSRWFGKCWYIHELLKYEFDVEFDVSLWWCVKKLVANTITVRVHNHSGPKYFAACKFRVYRMYNNNNNNNNNIHICIAPYGRNFRGAKLNYSDSLQFVYKCYIAEITVYRSYQTCKC